MAGFSDTFGILASGMRAQTARLRHVSENIANTDTPGYRAKSVTYSTETDPTRPEGAVQTGRVILDRAELPQIYDPSHPMANAEGFYEGSNVNLVLELADAREAQRSYEANIKMFEQTRRMSSALMDILKR